MFEGTKRFCHNIKSYYIIYRTIVEYNIFESIKYTLISMDYSNKYSKKMEQSMEDINVEEI